jgi:ADP-heptose:LPS heptosyltransferase
MFAYLQIYERRERALVGAADVALRVIAPVARVFRRKADPQPRRILLMRIERIGDLVMSFDAIADVVAAAPGAEIDLVVGSWNEQIARSIPGIRHVETLDAAWLARNASTGSMAQLFARGRKWRGRHYDLAINFEPDIRSHFLLAASGAARTAGFRSGGGGPLLDVGLSFDPRSHTSDNARRLVAAVLDVPPRPQPFRLELPDAAKVRARELLGAAGSPVVGVHVSGGREIKQWPPERFADVATRLARERGAVIVLTGAAGDRSLVEATRKAISGRLVIDLAGQLDLVTLGAVLERLDVLITGDTGPMHLAAAVGTSVVAVFGPSDPARYAPVQAPHRIVRIDLPCSPCNRIRLPPARCVGHTPDCLQGVDAGRVYRAALELMARGD